MRMVDFHAHLSCLEEFPLADFRSVEWETAAGRGLEELELRKQAGILTCFSMGRPWEWEAFWQFGEREEVMTSFGIHPWYADQYRMEECLAYFGACDVIGEIGMDSVWCETPLPVQEKLLEKELELAADLGKPVVLHTKGQEGRIAAMLRKFPGKICIHWYSGNEQDLERFLDLDCYFTLGPDTPRLLSRGDAVRCRMVKEIPANRLFVETDGIGAAAWAEGTENLDLRKIPGILEASMARAAEQKGLTACQLQERMRKNLEEFLSLPALAAPMEDHAENGQDDMT